MTKFIHSISEEILRADLSTVANLFITMPNTTLHFKLIQDAIVEIALADIGFAEECDYELLAIRLLGMCGYPASNLTGFAGRPTSVAALANPGAVRDVYTVVGMIRRCQDEYYGRIVQSINRIFGFKPGVWSASAIKNLVIDQLNNMSYLLEDIKPLHPSLAVQRINHFPFTTESVVTAIKMGLPPIGSDREDNYNWINHRTIKMASVALFHGLLRWVNGRYLCPTELADPEIRQGAIIHPHCMCMCKKC